MINREVLDNAYQIALRTLRDRYVGNGIFAGKSHFSDIWVRDSMYASFGSLSVGDYEVVKTNLQTVMSYMKPDGQLPLRIGQKYFLVKFLFGYSPPVPGARYTEDKGVSVPVDSNSLFLIVLDRYVQSTKDITFVTHHMAAIKKIMDWNFTQDSDQDLLIEEGPYAGWADSLKKRGKVAYTNVLHLKAVQVFAGLCTQAGLHAEATHYQNLAEQVRLQLHRQFWNGHFFTDFIEGSRRMEVFSTDANLLSIVFGIASATEAQCILSFIARHRLDSGFTIATNYPRYEWDVIYPPFFFVNMADYHNGLRWLWIGCIDVISKVVLGRHTEAGELLTRIAEKIVEYEGVFEVYEHGKPVRRLFYNSET
ncbi:MAG: GH116 family glycosyl hydrolase, partial [Candidatus Margulisiibacteriota bacterium]